MLKSTYKTHTVIQPFYTGGDVAIVDNLMASSCGESVVLTDISTGSHLSTVEVDGELITAIDISPDKSTLVVCSRSLLLHMYRLVYEEEKNTEQELEQTGKEEEEQNEDNSSLTKSLKLTVRKFKQIKAHQAPVLVTAIDPTSTLIATGSADSTVKIWDLKGGFATHNLKGHGGLISALKFWTKQGSTQWKLASGSDDCKVKVWDLVKSKCIATLDNHVSVVRGVDFNNDGSTLISAGRDKVVSVWQLSNKKYELFKTIPVYESIESAGFVSKDSTNNTTLIYTAGESGLVSIRDISTSDHQAVLKETSDLSSSEEQTFKVIISNNRLYNVLTDQMIVELNPSDLKVVRRIAGNHGEIIDCVFTDNSSVDTLVVATNSPELRVVSISRPLDVTILTGHTDIAICIDRTFDGSYLVSAGKDNTVRLWRRTGVTSYEPAGVFSGHAGSIGAVAVSRIPELPHSGSTGTFVPFIISGSNDLTVKRWDTKSGHAVYTRKAHDKDINAIDVSPDDRMFATASQDRLVKIWNTQTGEVAGTLTGHRRGVWTVRFSAWDKVVATGSGDKTIKLWTLSDMQCIRTFEGHSNSVLKVIFFNNGKQLASAAADGLVKIWDVSTGECLATLDNHEDKVWSLVSSGDNDGSFLVSGAGDSVVTVWQDVTEQTLADADEQEALRVEKEQQLENLIRSKDWSSAFTLALALDHPYRLLKLLTEVRDCMEPGSYTGLSTVDETIAALQGPDLIKFLGRLRDWNTNARTSPIAQSSLHAVLKSHSPATLCALPDIKSLVDALLPYSDRHLTRVDDLLCDTSVVEYAIQQMLFI